MVARGFLLLVLFVLFTYAAAASEGTEEYKSGEFVTSLTKDTFEDFVGKNEYVLVEFFAPWCPHCKSLGPEYASAAKELHEQSSPIKLADVNCDANQDVCNSFNIAGFPTLKLFKNGKEFRDFEGGRQSSDIVSWVKRKCGPVTKSLADKEQVEQFLADQKTNEVTAVIGYFKSEDSELRKSFSEAAEAADDFAFGDVVGSQVDKERVELRRYFKQDEPLEIKETEATNMVKFIRDNGFPLVDEINGKSFKRFVDTGLPIAVLFVKYSDESKKRELLDMIQKPAEALKEKIVFGYSDGEEYGAQLEMMGGDAKNLPALAAMNIEKRNNFPYKDELTPDKITAWGNGIHDGSIKPYLRSQPVPEKNDESVTVLVGSTFESVVMDESKDVLVEFYAPWCGHCKRLAPKYEKLAKYFEPLKDKLVIAKIDATENDVPDVSVEGFPTILFFPSGKKQNPVQYEGERTVSGFKRFLKREAIAANEAIIDLLKKNKASKEENDKKHDEL